MATHSSILAWRIPWTEDPGGYSPWGRKESDMTEQQSRNIGVHVFFSIMFFSGYMSNSGIARSYGSFIPSF